MSEAIKMKRIRVYGVVQGVGFRPTVARHASEAGITGTVSNRGPFVEIFAEGTEAKLQHFRKLLTTQPPRRASILKLTETEVKLPQFPDFRIIESGKTSGEIFISPDIAMCPECEEELLDPANRRYLHPFINCTCCGPRLSILDSLPYDRERTAMKKFAMCPDCGREYTTPSDRRYDAQPVCCPHCGPVYSILKAEENAFGESIPASAPQNEIAGSDAAIRYARSVILRGGIVAVKGIGGFHLCCDATSEAAVQKLRERKTRPAKPFAVMARNLSAAEDICEISPEESEILGGHQKPILLLRKRKRNAKQEAQKIEAAETESDVPANLSMSGKTAETIRIADAVATENPYLGVMLPYAPIHRLLFDYPDGLRMPDVLVMTSGNHAGAPICRDDESAVRELGGIADCILSNNRDIRLRADDSVLQLFRGDPLMLRRSRGYAPLPYTVSALALPDADSPAKRIPQVLAVGGELKNTFCFGMGELFYPGSYVGDLTDIRTCDALRESIQRMETLLEAKPQVLACDLHPRYNSTAAAEEIAESRGLPLVRIQHHYAHIAACMAENDYDARVIGIAMDGTGYGTDGSVWGGELLLADYHGFTRAASLKPFLQIGGDLSSREGWRIAVSMIYSLEKAANRLDSDIGSFVARNHTEEMVRKLRLCDQNTLRGQFMLHDRNLNAITSTSCGRLFDAVSAILGIRLQSSYEGEAAIQLMYRAEASRFTGITWEMLEAPETDGPAGCVRRLMLEFYEFMRAEEQREAALGQSSVLEEEAIWEDTEAEVSHEIDSEDERLIVRTDLLFRFILNRRLDMLQSSGQPSAAGFPHGKMPAIPADPAAAAAASGSADMPMCDTAALAPGTDELAWFFHLALAQLLSEAAAKISVQSGISTAALSGGSFQNTLLLGMTEDILKSQGIRVLRHHLIPPNDGGIALGQAVVAMAAMNRKGDKSCV